MHRRNDVRTHVRICKHERSSWMMAHEGIGKFRVGYQSIKTDTTRALLGKKLYRQCACCDISLIPHIHDLHIYDRGELSRILALARQWSIVRVPETFKPTALTPGLIGT